MQIIKYPVPPERGYFDYARTRAIVYNRAESNYNYRVRIRRRFGDDTRAIHWRSAQIRGSLPHHRQAITMTGR